MKSLVFYAVSVAALAAAAPALASVTVPNTGSAGWTAAFVNNQSPVPTYAQVDGASYAPASTVASPGGYYWASSPSSSWISFNTGGAGSPGYYAFRTTANATSSADSLAFTYAVDDNIVGVYIGNTLVASNLSGGYGSFSNAAISGFSVGANVLTFVVQNNYAGQNNGANAIGFNLSAVPEPATWGMMVLGFGAIGLTVRRRSARQARIVAA